MAHIPLAGATPDLRGLVGSEEVDVLRPESGALCRDQASLSNPLAGGGPGAVEQSKNPSQLLEL